MIQIEMRVKLKPNWAIHLACELDRAKLPFPQVQFGFKNKLTLLDRVQCKQIQTEPIESSQLSRTS